MRPPALAVLTGELAARDQSCCVPNVIEFRRLDADRDAEAEQERVIQQKRYRASRKGNFAQAACLCQRQTV